MAAGLAFADFAGFLASGFFAAASFFAAISVAPLEKLRVPCPELSPLFGTRKGGDSKVRHPDKGSELLNLTYRTDHETDPIGVRQTRQAENVTQQQIVENRGSATSRCPSVSRRRNLSRHSVELFVFGHSPSNRLRRMERQEGRRPRHRIHRQVKP